MQILLSASRWLHYSKSRVIKSWCSKIPTNLLFRMLWQRCLWRYKMCYIYRERERERPFQRAYCITLPWMSDSYDRENMAARLKRNFQFSNEMFEPNFDETNWYIRRIDSTRYNWPYVLSYFEWNSLMVCHRMKRMFQMKPFRTVMDYQIPLGIVSIWWNKIK